MSSEAWQPRLTFPVARELISLGVPGNFARQIDMLLLRNEPHSEIDFAHGPQHTAHMKAVASGLTDLLKRTMSENDRWRLEKGIENHDRGYGLVPHIDRSLHHYASAALALRDYGDLELAQGILLHSNDVLPEGTKLWISLLRDIDRTTRMGWAGLVALSSYVGYKHERMFTQNETEWLFDPRIPVEVDFSRKDVYRQVVNDYEAEIARFCWFHLFPYLNENNLFGKMIELYSPVLNWGTGLYENNSAYSKAYRLKLSSPITYQQKLPFLPSYHWTWQDDEDKLVIDPIFPAIWDVFDAKFENTFTVLDFLRAGPSLNLPNGR